ncbi:hypothetical protein ACPOL_7225 (plasmid) [Acidisarcina polymorpha]|uniref:Uncharacterized protein n=1 Tax=Acidisarcina polymorpha TaxID=2211140 RepID=A0A2Z5GCR3_9BACT|nr:hypothetical protein [Acidisarcina polymorpha]AXC16415.1 hypothetical protein ACPOL_7225 [Acidisarcina polymorpha]
MERIDGWGQTRKRRRLIRHWMETTPESTALDRGTLQGLLASVMTAFILFMAVTLSASRAHASESSIAETLKAQYPLTKVGVTMLKFDYNRITQPGAVLTVRVPGIYADVANTTQAIVNTSIVDGQAIQQKGFLASLSDTHESRTLTPGETVYVTKLDVKGDQVRFELLTVNVTTLGSGIGTRYRAEVTFHIPNLDTLKADEVQKTIDAVIADSATANAVESKTIKVGMSTEEVKKVLGNPEKIVDLGEKQIYIYKDMKVIFKDSQVSDVE